MPPFWQLKGLERRTQDAEFPLESAGLVFRGCGSPTIRGGGGGCGAPEADRVRNLKRAFAEPGANLLGPPWGDCSKCLLYDLNLPHSLYFEILGSLDRF